MTEEKKIQNQILEYLRLLEKQGYPLFFERRQAGGFSYKKGIPDLYVVINGNHIEVEVKRPGGKLSVMQEKFRDICKEKNIDWVVIDDINVFKCFIEKYLHLK